MCANTNTDKSSVLKCVRHIHSQTHKGLKQDACHADRWIHIWPPNEMQTNLAKSCALTNANAIQITRNQSAAAGLKKCWGKKGNGEATGRQQNNSHICALPTNKWCGNKIRFAVWAVWVGCCWVGYFTAHNCMYVWVSSNIVYLNKYVFSMLSRGRMWLFGCIKSSEIFL